MEMRYNAGFTLIELSIVLVIIGLIVGGVLVGRDLIQAAAVRAQVGQIEKYNAAVNTFRLKYNAVPGDMVPAMAAVYGFFQLTNTTGAQGMGDGNGVLEDGGGVGGGANSNQFGGEISTFWRHLSDANLVDGQFGTTGNSLLTAAAGLNTATVTNISQSMPAAKIGRGMSVTVLSGRGTNYYGLYQIVKIGGTPSASLYTSTLGITPIEAQNIDAKIDDGSPETGIVLAVGPSQPAPPGGYGISSLGELIGGAAPSFAGSSTLNRCVIGTGVANTDTYNLIPSTGGNDNSCALAIRFQ
jgi:prepilin-type N-terminal cleavage/methylation domain-containing protein